MTDPEAFERARQGALDLEKRVFWLAWICWAGGIGVGRTLEAPEWAWLLLLIVGGLFLMRFAVRGAIYWPFIRARRRQRRLDRTR